MTGLKCLGQSDTAWCEQTSRRRQGTGRDDIAHPRRSSQSVTYQWSCRRSSRSSLIRLSDSSTHCHVHTSARSADYIVRTSKCAGKWDHPCICSYGWIKLSSVTCLLDHPAIELIKAHGRRIFTEQFVSVQLHRVLNLTPHLQKSRSPTINNGSAEAL